jgi:rhodanese-related sulfurtransferase
VTGGRDRLRGLVRQGLVRGLRAVRERVAEGAGDRTGRAPAEPDLRPEDVRLDALHLVRQHGVGVDLAFVDLRPPEVVVATGTLPGAVRRSADDVVRRWRELADDVVVLIDGGDDAATPTALRLRSAGHGHAWALQGGFDAWRRAGGEIEPA